jgi:Flp pilus assembly protein TadB
MPTGTRRCARKGARRHSTEHQTAKKGAIIMGSSYAAPMSFVGSTRRMSAWARGHRSLIGKAFAWSCVAVSLLLVWMVIAGWYVIVFGIFGVFTIPFRLMRRGQRKSLAVQRQQLETMKQMQSGR